MTKHPDRVSSWRAVVLTRIDALESDLAALKVGGRHNVVIVEEAEKLLTTARDAALARSWRLRAWWSGAGIERAWRSVHSAEALVATVLPLERLRPRYPAVVADARHLLRSSDPRRRAVERWLSPRRPAGDAKAEHARYATSLGWVSSASDNAQARVRSFRNVLIAVTLVITVVATGLVVIGIFAPDALPVCVEPTAGEGGVVAQQQISQPICPSGGTEPSGGDVPLVAFVGLVGASLASAVALRRIRGTSRPYSVPLALAALKLPTGALTALAGLMLIQGEFIPGLSALDDPAQVLSYSIILGYGQEVFTRLVDRQGQAVLNSTPGPTPQQEGHEEPPPEQLEMRDATDEEETGDVIGESGEGDVIGDETGDMIGEGDVIGDETGDVIGEGDAIGDETGDVIGEGDAIGDETGDVIGENQETGETKDTGEPE
jgi:hypothetical protein